MEENQFSRKLHMDVPDRFSPLLNHVPFRMAVGLLLAVIAGLAVSLWVAGRPNYLFVILVIVAWWISVVLTDKYRHKYPHRYDTYLLASHAKALTIIIVMGLIFYSLGLLNKESVRMYRMAIILLSLADYLLSLPRRLLPVRSKKNKPEIDEKSLPDDDNSSSTVLDDKMMVNTEAIIRKVSEELAPNMVAFIQAKLPRNNSGTDTYLIINDISDASSSSGRQNCGIVVGRRSLNEVCRLNNYLKYSGELLVMGGFLVVSYKPLESVLAEMRRRVPRAIYPFYYLKHLVWYRLIPKIPIVDRLYFSPVFRWIDLILRRYGARNDRALSKAELLGRLAYYGLDVLAETDEQGLQYVLAQKVARPLSDQKPSFYSVVALEKVGLGGEPIRLHKLRSMYPFSEFIQKKIYQSHGLSSTGKIKNDFRLTGYGLLIRRFWIDEIPGIYDWVRGDIKLVGMRATSPHFLSLYPREVYELYTRVKPGLVPPIFDESTRGFDQIVEIEKTYLKRYLEAPIKTDIVYFWYTLRDIIFRKVRSS